MREIKFRGRKPNGEWVYGYYVGKDTIIPFGEVNFDLGFIDTSPCYEVIPDTIGQFTGLHDKNGKEIYDGDILRDFEYPFYNAQADAYNYYAIVDWDADEAQFYAYNDLARGAQVRGVSCGVGVDMGYLREMEVIGNIYDNLGLLKS